MAEIKSLSIAHQAIMDYLMAHPNERLQDVARHFDYTPQWLSQIIHSDAFQTMLRERQDGVFHHTVLPLREKMMATAHIAIDKLNELLPTVADARTARDITEGMLDRLGFGAKPIGGNNLTINQQNTTLIMPSANEQEIAEARALLTQKRGPALGVTLNGHGVPLALPREGSASVGEALPAINLPFTEGEYTEGEGGDKVREESSRAPV